ncbi:MAG: permease [Dissulfurimicrobium sp.]|uniref:permease n=1 Tax=Dissulfurimicrobium sp. TaxID=2022436 RepID=UPI00404A498A
MLKIFTILADLITYQWLGLDPKAHLTEAIHFFIEDTTKIFFLLATIIFFVAIIRSFFPPERTRRFLSNKKLIVGHILAAALGVVTPFCSCSACPLFIGFVEAGIPLGVTFSFLISSPMVNEVALILLFGLFGWKIAAIYLFSGLTVAIVAGIIIGRLEMERFVADYVWKIRMGEAEVPTMSWQERIDYARGYVKDILRRIWPYVLGGIAVGAFVHGYVPHGFLLKYAGPGNPFAVPIAVLLGVPLYSNAAGVIPIVQALMSKGLPLGTTLAFMMAVTALSFPEAVILSQVLKKELLAVFFGTVTVSIIIVGYLFNAIMG